MPSIKLNKLSKELELGVQSVVAFLNEKKKSDSYNPNSKLSTEEMTLVVRELGTALSESEKKAIIEKFAAKPETSAPAAKVPEPPATKASEPEHSPAAPQQPRSGQGLKVLGKLNLDPKGNVIPPSRETPKPVSKPEPKPEVKPAEEPASAAATPIVAVKVVGHVDLSKFDTGRGGSKRKKERKRTLVKGSEKIDIEKQSREQGAKQQSPGKTAPGQKGKSNKGGDQNRKETASARNAKSQEAVGRKAKAQKKKEQARQNEPSHEITQEEIQRQIKETMAQLQGRKGSGNAAKYRRDKRDERRRDEERKQQAELEAGKHLQLTEFVTPNDLAQMMDIPVNEIITLVFNLGMMVSINQRLDKDTIELIVEEYGYEADFVDLQVADVIETEEDDEEDLEPRAPIVTVMGHVDHGKTSLLDAIRNTDVIAHEAGGITQHVGAYRVTLDDGRSITFLDTPGHEAFTAMRARGAQVTDVVIIVVAANDGVMPQTKEAISHASLAGVPIVFAINKIDVPGANPEKIKEELANMNYLVEDWGGKYQSQEISAKKGIGIKDLLEKVLIEAELLDLKANPHKRARGSVLESTMEVGRGYTTKVLVQDGTLKVGDYIVAGSNFGRVKALFDDRGKNVTKVGPSEPVKVLGLNGATTAGETLNVMETEAEAREIAARREQLHREQRERTQRMPSLMDLGRRIAEGKAQELNIIVKGDMDGSVEALSDSIEKLSTEEIHVRVIYKAVGQITESDVSLASASDAIIIGFQVRPAQGAKRDAEEAGVEIRTYSVIYDALDDVKTAMEGMLSPETKERVTANLQVRETFRITKVGTIAGCFVTDGKVSRGDKVRVIRGGVVVHTGELASLKRFKDDAKEVSAGLECGISIANYNDIQVDDEIEAYQEYEVKRTLE